MAACRGDVVKIEALRRPAPFAAIRRVSTITAAIEREIYARRNVEAIGLLNIALIAHFISDQQAGYPL
jgi:hypothetical protein